MASRKALEYMCSKLAPVISKMLPQGVGFALLLFDYGDPADGVPRYLAYISSGERADMVAAMREALARFEAEQIKQN